MSDVFAALSSPVRRDILKLLKRRAHSAGEIADAIGLAKPTLSGHFNVLKAAGLITPERQGTVILYRVNMTVMEEAIAALMALAGVQGKKGKPPL